MFFLSLLGQPPDSPPAFTLLSPPAATVLCVSLGMIPQAAHRTFHAPLPRIERDDVDISPQFWRCFTAASQISGLELRLDAPLANRAHRALGGQRKENQVCLVGTLYKGHSRGGPPPNSHPSLLKSAAFECKSDFFLSTYMLACRLLWYALAPVV